MPTHAAVQPPPLSASALPAHLGWCRLIFATSAARSVQGHEPVEAASRAPLSRASQIRSQRQRQRGWKLYPFHAPEVECIGKGKARAPWEFVRKGVDRDHRMPGSARRPVRAARRSAAGQSLPTATHCGPSSRTPCASPVARSNGSTSTSGYRGHDQRAGDPRRVLHLLVSARCLRHHQTRAAPPIRRHEPLIGHMKEEGHLGRCYLKGRCRRCCKRHPRTAAG